MNRRRQRCFGLSGGMLVVLCAGAAAADLTDPTREPEPPITVRKIAAAPTRLPRVSAIFHGGQRNIAIFDGLPVQAGDQVGVYHIEAVTANGVLYRVGDKAATALLRTPRPEPLPKDH
jgi:hypothetical protein